MKALVWKELRENLLWAVLAMLALGAGEIYALHHSQYQQQDPYFYNGITLCKKSFLTVTMFGYAVAGTALGLLQVLPELKRDRWAALLHLPLSRGRFFWGKAMAGAALYFVAAGLPLLFAVWNVAGPGNFATPFLPKMVLPALADLATGLCYYFAALLMALQGGRIAWRALPLFAALHVTFFAIQEDSFRVAMECAVAMAFVICLAGWGAIHARESLRGRPLLGSTAFLVVAFYGAIGAGDLVKALGGMAGRMGISKYSYWETLDTGAPARIDYVKDVIVSATDVHGRPFTDPSYVADRVRSHTLGMNSATFYVGSSHGWHRTLYPRSYRESNGYLYSVQPYFRPRPEQWFYILDGRYFTGILQLEKRESGRLGMDGFAPAGGTAQSFPEGVFPTQVSGELLVIAASESLRFVHLATRQITSVAIPAPGPIYGACHSWARLSNGVVDFEGVALSTGMAVYDRGAHAVAFLPYQHDADRWGRVSLGILKSQDRFILKAEPSDWIDGKTKRTMPSYIDVMDSKGTVLASYEMAPLPPGVNPPLWNDFIAQRLESPLFFFGEMVYRRIGAAFGFNRLREALEKQLGSEVQSTLQISRVLILVALSLSAVTWFWARKAQLPVQRVWAWTIGVLLLGWPGLVIFWLAGERPRTVPCAACGQRRQIGEEHCAHCGAGWPAKSTDGTEILDRAQMPSTAASA